MQTKKMAAIILSVVTALGSTTAFADWKSAGYDTTNLNDIKKIYNEVIGGKYTSKYKSESLALKDIQWKTEGYELAYPHAGYDRLYLEGNAQKITRYNNLFPQWETRFADYFWELYGEHRIYQRQQTKIPDIGWRWDFSDDAAVDSWLFVPTNRNAVVTEDFKVYGVGPYNLRGYVLSDEEKAMYARFNVEEALNVFPIQEGTKKEIAEGTFFHYDNLSQLDENGEYVWSDAEIADYVGSVQSKWLTGPSLRGDDPTKNVAKEYLLHGDNWQWDSDTLRYGGGDVSWTGVMYEAEEPYLMYQYMIINGVVFDGHNDLPRIFRYTSGKASPKVEWKRIAVESEHAHAVIEVKYLDGKLAYDSNDEVVWRTTGEFENCYVVTTPTEIQLWVTGIDEPIEVISRVGHDLGYYAGYMGASNYVAN